MKIISIDPSGSGTTAIFITFLENNIEKEINFSEIINLDWKKHYLFIKKIIEKEKPEFILLENTNYIHKKTKDGLSLFRLLGAIEFIDEKKEIISINVIRVKELRKKILKKELEIEKIIYKKGRGGGWMINDKKISTHSLDSYLIYFFWKNKIKK